MKASTLLENSYYQWLKKELVFSEIGNNYAAISTPFLTVILITLIYMQNLLIAPTSKFLISVIQFQI
ncbi:hypothetical protein [Limosilactobacillus viscerum]|uniref:hypothetical protein n=1 Tax=Limosilactobacillus viscerum TaxID=2993450 RepID=UPI0024B96D29|nr:hypothetical protein [Limosilactobacillus viscerum]